MGSETGVGRGASAGVVPSMNRGQGILILQYFDDLGNFYTTRPVGKDTGASGVYTSACVRHEDQDEAQDGDQHPNCCARPNLQ